MTKKLALISISFLLILISVVFLGLYTYYRQLLQPVSASSLASVPIQFTINPSEPASAVAYRLQNQNLVKSAWATIVYLKITGLENQFKPGMYPLSPRLSAGQLIAVLTQGPSDVKITFPEGWRREQIASRLAANLPSFNLADFLSRSATLEGQLFPDTYLFAPSATANDVLIKFSRNFSQKSGLTLPDQTDLLIIASLVEREAKNDSDRRLVAGILLNRLGIGMPLQVDATVQYAVDSQKCHSQITSCTYWLPINNTQFPSPYNTYQIPNLPPLPISNPGKASINAVLNPQPSDYLYYLTDLRGVTHYARTLSEHNQNIDNYLRF